MAKCRSLGCWTTLLLPKPLSPRDCTHHEHDATWQIPVPLAKGYSPECVEGEFCELRSNGVLRSSRLTSSDGIIGGALSDSLEKAGRKRRRVNATSAPQRHGSVLSGGWPRRDALSEHARRIGVRSHLPAPLARPFGRRSAPRLLRLICPPSQAKIMQERIRNSELVVFEESGHVPYVEEPKAFFEAVRGWLGRT